MDNNFNNQQNNQQYSQGFQNGYGNQVNNGYGEQVNNGYGNPVNNGYGNQVYNGNYNANFGGAYNTYYNPTPNMPMIRKARKTGAVLLSILLGFILINLAPLIALNFGTLSGGDFRDIVNSSAIRDELKSVVQKEINISDFKVELSDEATDAAIDAVALIVESGINGEVPSKDEIREDFEVIYQWLADEYIDAILDDVIDKGGEIGFKSGEGDVSLKYYFGDEMYQYMQADLLDEYGGSYKVTNKNRDEIKDYIKNVVLDQEDVFEEYIDEVYDELEDKSGELTDELGDSAEVITNVVSVYNMMLLILSISAVVIVLIQFLIDRNVGMTIKGLFGPFLVAGILTLLGGLVVLGIKLIGEATLGSEGEDELMISFFSSFIGGIAMPIIIVGIICIVIGIVTRVVGKTLYNASEEKLQTM